MLRERVCIVVALGLLLAACSTTGGSGYTPISSDKSMPRESAAEQARHAAEVHTELGQKYMQRGRLQRALKKLEKAEQFDPGYVPAHTLLGVLYERIGKHQLAEQQYRKAQSLDPDKGSVNNNLGQFLCKSGKVEESLAYFSKAVHDPFYDTPAAAYVNAGTCLLKLGKTQQATVQLRSALDINNADANALYLMAKALVHEQDYFHASAFYQRFKAVSKMDPESLMLGYTIQSKLGNQERARNYARKLQEKFPDSTQARSLGSKGQS